MNPTDKINISYTKFFEILKNNINNHDPSHIIEVINNNKKTTMKVKLNTEDEETIWGIIEEFPIMLQKIQIYEKFEDKTKVIIEINKDKIGYEKRKIEYEDKINIITCIQSTILNILDIQNYEDLVTIYIEDEEKIKITLPNIRVKYNTLKNEIIDTFVRILKEKETLKIDEENYTLKNIINTKIYTKIYKVTEVLDNTNYMINNEENNIYEIYGLIDVEEEKTLYPLEEEKIKEIFNIDKEKEITRITYNKLASLNYLEGPLFNNLKIETKKIKAITNIQLIAERINDKKKNDIEILNELKEMLSIKRCFKITSFINIGECIYSITKDIKGLKIWEEITERLKNVYHYIKGEYEEIQEEKREEIINNDNYKELTIKDIDEKMRDILENENIYKYIEKEYENFEEKNMSLGTFRYWCKNDNVLLYNEWKNNNIKNLLWICINPTGGMSDIAEVLYKKYQDKFICTSIKDQIWYEFKDHRYQELDKAITIRKILTDELTKIFNDLLDECNIKVQKLSEGVEQEKWKLKQDACIKIIKGLKSPGFKTQILSEASEKFYYPNFSKFCNKNKNIFVFENCVLDYSLIRKDNKIIDWIRDGTPDDLTTICCNQVFKFFDDDDPKLKQCYKYLSQVFVDQDIRYYFLTAIASCLKGGNDRKEFIFLTGQGNNSKSVIESIIENAFGDYFGKPPTSLLTSKRTASSNATPELEVLRVARIAMFQEPKQTDVLNDGILKELSSGFDTIYSRALNKMPEKIHPQFTPFMVCNHIPSTDGSDIAVTNRIRIIEFTSTFSHNYPDTEEEQFKKCVFPIDKEFDRKIPELIQPFLFILIKYLYDYKFIKKPIPNQVEMAGLTYKQRNDIFKTFIDEKLTHFTDNDYDSDSDDRTIIRCRIDSVFNCYKLWLQQNMSENKTNILEFKDDMKRHGVVSDNKYYYNIKINDD